MPRDGPWIFVAVAEAWDRGEVRGAWVRASASKPEVVQVVAVAVGEHHELGALAVVDEVGMERPYVDWSGREYPIS